MNIVMCSNQSYDIENDINKRLKDIVGDDAKICCIICNKNTILDEEKRESFYKKLGFKNVKSIFTNNFILNDKEKSLNLEEFDVLHIESDNLLYFIENFGVLNIKDKILNHISLGKMVVTVGEVSALCSKDVGILDLIHDDNSYKKIKGLDIVDFEYFPFWSSFKEKLPSIIEYSFNNKCTVYCCRDEYGIIVKGDNVLTFGETVKVCNGEVSYMNGNIKIY